MIRNPISAANKAAAALRIGTALLMLIVAVPASAQIDPGRPTPPPGNTVPPPFGSIRSEGIDPGYPNATGSVPRAVVDWAIQNRLFVARAVDPSHPNPNYWYSSLDPGAATSREPSLGDVDITGYWYRSDQVADAPPAVRDWLNNNLPGRGQAGFGGTPAGAALQSYLIDNESLAFSRATMERYGPIATLSPEEARRQNVSPEMYDYARRQYRRASEDAALRERTTTTFADNQRRQQEERRRLEEISEWFVDPEGELSGLGDSESRELSAQLLQELLEIENELRAHIEDVQRNGVTGPMNSGSSFSMAALEPIYINSILAGYRGLSSAGAEGFDAVPWLSRWGTGVSSAGNSLSSAPGGLFLTLNYMDHQQVYIQATALQLAGDFEGARRLIQMHAPVQFGGMAGGNQNFQFYMALLEAFVGGDPTRAAFVFGNQALVDTLAGLSGLSPEEIARQIALRGYEGALRSDFFFRTSASDLIGIGGLGLIRGQLVWATSADLDLHLFVPGGGHVYFGNDTVQFNGMQALAQLDHDNLGGTIDVQPNLRVENIVVTGANIPAGTYDFLFRVFSANSNPSNPYTFTWTIDAGHTAQQVNGTLGGTGSEATQSVVLPSPGSFP